LVDVSILRHTRLLELLGALGVLRFIPEAGTTVTLTLLNVGVLRLIGLEELGNF
jgi:hypothetical protein